MRVRLPKRAPIESLDLVEACRRATAKELSDADPARNACVVQCISSGRFGQSAVVDVLSKRLRQKRPHKQYLAVRLIGDVLAAHPDLRPALLQQITSAQMQPMNRYSNTLKEQQRFKAAANELLQENSPLLQGKSPRLQDMSMRLQDKSPRGEVAGQPGPAQHSLELEQALSVATTTAKELAHKVQEASLDLASGCGSEASVVHAGKAAELLCTRFEVVLGQAGPNHEAAVAGAMAALDKLNGSLQLRDEVLHGCRAGAEATATSSGGVVSLHSGSDAFDELLASRKA